MTIVFAPNNFSNLAGLAADLNNNTIVRMVFNIGLPNCFAEGVVGSPSA
jgi:hypothetical protein